MAAGTNQMVKKLCQGTLPAELSGVPERAAECRMPENIKFAISDRIWYNMIIKVPDIRDNF